MHLIAYLLGLDVPPSAWYDFWSGIGSDLGEFAIVAVIWHHLNCHENGCWRIAGHRAPATGFRSCMLHRRTAQMPLEER